MDIEPIAKLLVVKTQAKANFLELRQREIRRILIPRHRANRGNKEGRRCSGLGPCAAQHPGRGVGVVSGIGLLLLS
jgi:hypothetical protein